MSNLIEQLTVDSDSVEVEVETRFSLTHKIKVPKNLSDDERRSYAISLVDKEVATILTNQANNKLEWVGSDLWAGEKPWFDIDAAGHGY
jgi:hypothetical protein